VRATQANLRQLRLKIGELVAEGEESLFTDDDLAEILRTSPHMERAAYEGWRIKAAHFANLVDVVDGAASRKFSDLLDNARGMMATYLKAPAGPSDGRSRIGRIVRPWTGSS